MDKAKLIVKYLILLTTQPEQTWVHLAQGEAPVTKPQHMMTNYYWPLLGFMALFIFVTSGFAGVGSFDLQQGMLKMVPALVGYFVGPYLALFALKELLPMPWFQVAHPDQDRLQLFVFFSTSYLVLVEMACSMIPSIAFVRLAAYYLIFITWTGSTTMIRVEDARRWLFGFVSFAIIYFSPIITMRILQFMQR